MSQLPEPTAWYRKVHPVFLEVAKVNRESEIGLSGWLEKWRRANEALGKNAPAARQEAVLLRLLDERDEFVARVEAQIDAIRSRHGDPPCKGGAFGYLHPIEEPCPDREPGPLFRLLHWLRFAKRFETTLAEDAKGDLNAYHALTKTGDDYRRVIFEQGPITPFKRDEVHRQLFEILSCYENDPLTAEELVNCFDQFCACGLETHSEDSLRKQYARLKDDLNAMR